MLGQGPRWAEDPRERDEDPREPDARERDRWNPRDVFLHELELPRGYERERVFDDDREYTLRGSESRTLATVGAFRVVPGHDLQDRDDRPLDPRNSELRHLREQGLVDMVRMDGRRDVAVFLTGRGHSLLGAQEVSGSSQVSPKRYEGAGLPQGSGWALQCRAYLPPVLRGDHCVSALSIHFHNRIRGRY
jgi:hypothetical protein